MTEAEWLAGTDPAPMLHSLNGRASERRLRRFACSCCGHSLQSFGHYELDEALNWVESSLNGSVRGGPPESVRDSIQWAMYEMCESLNCLGESLHNLIGEAAFDIALTQQTSKLILEAHGIADVQSSSEDEARFQTWLLREMFPFSNISLDTSWITSTVLALASGVYNERAFDRMPILADALEDAGCDNVDILSHCRQPREHVRGCWVVDLLTGRV